jgi:hypothetical protein
LQPAQGAPNLVAAPAAVVPATAANSQSIPVAVFGAAALLVLVLGAGLGVVISRRPTHQHA